QEVCSICPLAQITLCKAAWVRPDLAEVTRHARALGATGPVEIDERAIIVEGLDGPTRNYLQQVFGFQCHDRNNPHLYRQHGRAPIGWEAENGTPTP
ncbi:radical SAM protein, partial [Streptomyces mirabilis]